MSYDKQKIKLTIEKITNTGSGLAHHEGKTVFVDNTCPEDFIEADIIKQTKNYITAKPINIITPSKHRVQPFCPMFNVCGACKFQFVDYSYQLLIKQEMVKDAFKNNPNIQINQTIPSPVTQNYRHKIQYPVTQTANSKKLIAGYFKPKSHEIINIKYCPIQPNICNEIIEYIKILAPNYNLDGYNEKKHNGKIRHIVLRVSDYDNSILLTLVLNSDKKPPDITDFAKKIVGKYPQIKGISLNYNTTKSNLIMTDKSETVLGQNYIEEKLCDKIFKISTDTFFQVNPKTADSIFRFIKDYINQNHTQPSLLDAYAGIAAFGIALCDICKSVTSVETNKHSIDLAAKIISENNIKNIDLHQLDMTVFVEQNSSRKYDVSVIDPPRKGCETIVLDSLLKLTSKTLIYVSCNPITLARDVNYLQNFGAKVKFIQPFDMFCHTDHIECVAMIDTENVNV